MTRINESVTVITGASSGIGEAIARELAIAGGKVMVAARRENRLQALTSELGNNAAYHVTDITDPKQTSALVKATIERFGHVDVLINNAGVMPVSPFVDMKLDDWNKAIDINIRGVLHGIAAVLPHFMELGSGHVINIGSVASMKVMPNFGVYCGTKFAVRAISEALRQETLGIVRVTTIYPGAVESELVAASNDGKTGQQVADIFPRISATAISQAVRFAIEQPSDVSVSEMVVRPSTQEL